MNKNDTSISIAMLGATGAVGTEALKVLLKMPKIKNIALFGRRPVDNLELGNVQQHIIDIFTPSSYGEYLIGFDAAICTLGVGQPSKVSKEDFIKIDKQAVIDFAKVCKNSGVRHFQLLASVGINSSSSSFYLRSKGELVEELKALNFDRLSIFQPSMILTPNNRYGALQGFTLWLWPILNPLLMGGLKKYRGVKVEHLGNAFAKNIFQEKLGTEELTWQEFQELLDA